MPLKLTTYYHGSDIPELPGNNTFHSIVKQHLGMSPKQYRESSYG